MHQESPLVPLSGIAGCAPSRVGASKPDPTDFLLLACCYHPTSSPIYLNNYSLLLLTPLGLASLLSPRLSGCIAGRGNRFTTAECCVSVFVQRASHTRFLATPNTRRPGREVKELTLSCLRTDIRPFLKQLSTRYGRSSRSRRLALAISTSRRCGRLDLVLSLPPSS